MRQDEAGTASDRVAAGRPGSESLAGRPGFESLADSQGLEAMGLLVGGIAHDFNNLLTAILGAADAVLERQLARDRSDVETVADIEEIRGSALRGAALVRQLLAFGRHQALVPCALTVNDAITDLASMLRRLFGTKVQLELVLEQPGRQVLADPTQLDRVLINLAINARDAMPDGGVLTMRSGYVTLAHPLKLATGAIPPGSYVTVEVQDTGLGIAPDILPRIFDPFFTTKRDLGGNGLGLSTVRGIIGQSGGVLTVESEPGQGTRMCIYLPCWQESSANSKRPIADFAAVQPGRGAMASNEVLLVDDDDALRRLVSRALSRAGWLVLEADSGESALSLLYARPPWASLAAVVSDRMMPGIDGLMLVDEVRRWLGQPDLPAVLMSGFADSQSRSARNGGQTAFLMKPFSLADLLSSLHEIAGKPGISGADTDVLAVQSVE